MGVTGMRMKGMDDNAHPPRNRLLARLPTEEYEHLLRFLEVCSLDVKFPFYEPYQPIDYVYFPNNVVASILTVMDDGIQVEVGTVGNEGMIGTPVFLGAVQTTGLAFAQIPGEAMRMKSEEFRREVGRDGALTFLLHHYLQALFVQLSQSTACNRLHSLEQRTARWLLMTRDRVGNDEFPLTQEFLSRMLGVRRASVNAAARALQNKGLIRYRRGIITITDPAGLEAVCCECYRVVKAEYDRLLEK